MTFLPPRMNLSTIPVQPPPPGISSNFVDPKSLANAMLGTEIFTLVLTVLVVMIRLFSNYHTTRGVGWDDCFCVIATALLLINVVITLRVRRLARHYYDIPVIWITSSTLKEVFVHYITSQPMIFFAKASLFMLYYQLFKVQTSIRYAIIFGVIFSILMSLISMIVFAILCSPPVGHPWNFANQVKCVQTTLFIFILGITNLALDIYLLILPIPIILRLQLSVKKKIGILAIFLVGLLALAVSIISLIYRTKLWQGKDGGWNAYLTSIFTIIETGVTIICSSTSALVAFWKAYVANYVAPLRSRLCFSHSKLATRVKLVSRTSSSKQICPPELDPSEPYSSLHNLNYVELDELHLESAGFPNGFPRSELENGGIEYS